MVVRIWGETRGRCGAGICCRGQVLFCMSFKGRVGVSGECARSGVGHTLNNKAVSGANA